MICKKNDRKILQSGEIKMKQETIDRIRKFTEDRDWDQFH